MAVTSVMSTWFGRHLRGRIVGRTVEPLRLGVAEFR
jgi:hypothetical protein